MAVIDFNAYGIVHHFTVFITHWQVIATAYFGMG
jgi:hypothetical protein